MTIATATATPGPVRACCPLCYARFAWPDGTYLPGARLPGDPEPERMACPRCHRCVPLETERLDSKWWTHMQALPA